MGDPSDNHQLATVKPTPAASSTPVPVVVKPVLLSATAAAKVKLDLTKLDESVKQLAATTKQVEANVGLFVQQYNSVKASADKMGIEITSLHSDIERHEAEKTKLKHQLRIAIIVALLAVVAFFCALLAVKVNGVSGGNLVAIVGIVVAGVVILAGLYGAYAYGRIFQVDLESAESKHKLRIQVGKQAEEAKKEPAKAN